MSVTTMIQCNPTIPVYTKLGKGRTLFLIDYGQDVNTCWVVTLTKSGQVKHFDANDILVEENFTYGSAKITLPDGWEKE